MEETSKIGDAKITKDNTADGGAYWLHVTAPDGQSTSICLTAIDSRLGERTRIVEAWAEEQIRCELQDERTSNVERSRLTGHLTPPAVDESDATVDMKAALEKMFDAFYAEVHSDSQYEALKQAAKALNRPLDWDEE